MAKKAKTTKKKTKPAKSAPKKKPAKGKVSREKPARSKTAGTKKKAKASSSKASSSTKTASKKTASVKKGTSKPKAAVVTEKKVAKPIAKPVVTVAPLEEPPKLPTQAQLRRVKTDLSRKDLNSYRRLLLQKRTDLVGDVATLESGARNNHSSGNLSNMPMHMADIGSDNYEQEFALDLAESERRMLGEIDEALLRIQGRTYGVCLERSVPISRPRLDAKPWAKYCIEVAREKERGNNF